MFNKPLAFLLALSFSIAHAGPVVVMPSTVVNSGSTATLPVVTEGAACTATPTANTGIRADYTAILTCTNSRWTRDSGRCVGTTLDLNLLQEDGRCYNSAGNANSPAGADWFFLEVYRHTNVTNFYTVQRVKGMTGASVGKVWQRTQQSATSGAGWGAWNQIADPSVSMAGGSVTAGGNVTAGGHVAVGPNNRILGQGSQGSYGATTVAGQKNGWTGLEFRDSAGNYQVNQMTNRGMVGHYDITTGRWLEYIDTSGNKTLDQTADYNSGRLNPGWAVETWGCVTGQIAKAAYTVADGWAWNGKTLSCQSGVWKSPGGTRTCTCIQGLADYASNVVCTPNDGSWSPWSSSIGRSIWYVRMYSYPC